MHDSHVHLTTQPLYDYREQALDNFVGKGGKYLLNTSNSIENCYEVLELYKEFRNKYPNLIHNSIGIHPEEFITKSYENVGTNINSLKKILQEHRGIIHAIGECGLEYFHLLNNNDLTFEQKEEIIEIQKMAFREQINLAVENNLPMTIHSRDEEDSNYCSKETFNILVSEGKMLVRGCMHCYVGDEETLMDYLDMNFYIGYNAILTYKNGENVRNLVKKTPIENILLETDAPFLPLDRVRKEKKSVVTFGQPVDVFEIAKVVAEIKNLDAKKVLEITTENYETLFNL